jgi:hypothetical protein
VHLEGAIYPSLGFDAWPWGGTREKPDYSTFNEAYWDRVDARIRLAAARGIGINLTLFQSIRLPDSPGAIATFPALSGTRDRPAGPASQHLFVGRFRTSTSWTKSSSMKSDASSRPAIRNTGRSLPPTAPRKLRSGPTRRG